MYRPSGYLILNLDVHHQQRHAYQRAYQPPSPTSLKIYHPPTEPSPHRPIPLDSLLRFGSLPQVRLTIEWAFDHTKLFHQYLCTADHERETVRTFAQGFPSAGRRSDETFFHSFIIDGFLSLLNCGPVGSAASIISKERFTPLLSQMHQLVHPMGHQPIITMNTVQRRVAYVGCSPIKSDWTLFIESQSYPSLVQTRSRSVISKAGIWLDERMVYICLSVYLRIMG